MLDFGNSKSNSEVLKSNSWKITVFSKNTLLQREPSRTMFYTINSSPLLVLLKIILSKLPIVSTASNINGEKNATIREGDFQSHAP